MRKLLILLFYCVIVNMINAQSVTGKVIDVDQQPLEFANVVLLSLPDSVFMQGTISDQTGTFTLTSNGRPGILRISSIGYITVYKPYNGMDMGTIQLNSETHLLGEVVVKGDLPKTRIKGDAMITGVAGTLLEKAGTAENLLDKIPGVSANEGGVKVFGRGTPEIYINGLKVRDNSELDQLSADNIKSVEVINNPGARYAASVKAVIRISTKKALGDGFGFNNRAFASYNKKWTTLDQFNFNYRSGNFDLLGMLFVRDGYGWDDKVSVQRTYLDKYWEQNSKIYNEGHSQNISGMLALNYSFNEKHTLGIRYDYDRVPKSDLIIDMLTKVNLDNILYEESSSYGFTKNQGTDHRMNLYYNGKISGWNIDFNADGLWGKEYTNTHTNEETFYTTDKYDKRLVTTFNDVKNTLYATKLLFSHPLWGGELTFGGEYSHTRRTSKYLNPEGILDNDESEIKEGDLALFAEYSRSFGKVHLQAGLRYENVIFDYYEYGKRIDEQSKKYNNLFPALAISVPIGNVQMQLNYAADITRPYYYQLRSNVMYINRYTYEGGNPFLMPTLSHNVTLGGAYKSWQLSIGYQHIKDAMAYFSGAYLDEDPTIAIVRMVNAPTYDKVFGSLTFSPTIGIWTPQFNVQVEKQWYFADTPNGKSKLDTPIGIFSWKNSLKLPANFLFDINASCYSKGYSGNQQRLDNALIVSMALNKGILNNRLNFLLRANDLFNTMDNKFMLYTGAIRTLEFDNKPNARSVSLTVVYKFNSAKSKYKGTGAGETQKNRM